jgi:hypothetical protein
MGDTVSTRLVEILENARRRKEMYFSPVGPVAFTHWLAGLRTGLSITGVEWPWKYHAIAVEKRGLTYRPAAWETEELERRGLTPEGVVDELLAIEIEAWRSYRDTRTERDAASPTLDELLRGIKPDSLPDEWNTGPAVGKEIW